MAERSCPGLPADWLNAWLAAVGATVLVPDMTLRWSDDPVPLAVLAMPDDLDPVESIEGALPGGGVLSALPIARDLDGHRPLNWEPDVITWTDRAAAARSSTAGWMLTALYTDLAWSARERTHVIERGEFSTPAPQGRTMHDRLERMTGLVSSGMVGPALAGAGSRVVGNGLGFDLGRVASQADDTRMFVDPVIEVMAFYAMALFPVRGDGGLRTRQRGWSGSRSTIGAFRWPAWSPALGRDGIDALLDVSQTQASRMAANRWWEVVPFEASSSKDVTRGYGSRVRR